MSEGFEINRRFLQRQSAFMSPFKKRTGTPWGEGDLRSSTHANSENTQTGRSNPPRNFFDYAEKRKKGSLVGRGLLAGKRRGRPIRFLSIYRMWEERLDLCRTRLAIDQNSLFPDGFRVTPRVPRKRCKRLIPIVLHDFPTRLATGG